MANIQKNLLEKTCSLKQYNRHIDDVFKKDFNIVSSGIISMNYT